MANIYANRSSIKLPERHRIDQHGGLGGDKGVTVCPECHNVLYKKEWHHPGHASIARTKHDGGKVRRTACPACIMIKNRLFEGEVFIENFPYRHREELLNLIRAFGKRAEGIDPQDRIIRVDETAGAYRVTTTENQMAVKLAKKIREVFNTVKVRISYAPEPAEVSRIRVFFIERLEKSA